MGPPPNPSRLKRKHPDGRGEVPQTAPNSRVNCGAIQASTLGHGPSYTSSVPKAAISRHSTAAVRSSYGHGLGPDRRVLSKQYDRPQSAMMSSRVGRTASSTHRSNSSLDVHPRPTNGSQSFQNKGRVLFPSNPSEVYKYPIKPESHGCYEPQINCDVDWESPCAKGRLCDLSVTSAFKGFSIDGKTTPTVEMNAVLTPSQIPLRTCTHSVRAGMSSPSRSPKKPPLLARFLTRDSNTPVAWTPEEKLEECMMYDMRFRENMSGATNRTDYLSEALSFYKTRG